MPGFTVAIVGRPNVGKSTLFNRLLEQRKAIVDDFSGVTRDRQYGISDWNGKFFNVIDTGGFVSRSEDIFEKEIRKQVHIAIDEADIILFITDVTAGITDLDDDMAQLLRRSNKPVFLVVNKVDNAERQLDATEFYVLGFDPTFFLSSISGSGTGEVLDAITELIPESTQDAEVEMIEEEIEDEDGNVIIMKREKDPIPKIAIIGQPNAGKSTLLNALTGKERAIVSDIAGTTRDPIHTHYNQFGKEFILIDTAGLRKKKAVQEDLEFYSVIRAIKAMDEADVCMLLIDAAKGMTAQDVNILSLAERKGKAIVILVNKWDVVEGKETNTARDYEKNLKERIAPFTDIPVVFTSAAEKTRIFQAIEKALEVFENRLRRITTSHLNEVMLKEIERFTPPVVRGHSVRIKFVMQIPTHTPAFAFYSNHPDEIKTPYRNFLENKLRSHFNFSGVPIKIFFRKK
ncbi:ribosome biogenesis GTPase Der [Taibaiella chishuiensis]|uniref:GTPase Der n=1 Tax=Taibaiella chishuiensis TaxID=1434707 RepID=A0A2P8CZ97_9BACT|nr:ribosome biogenesis GTPase Der [Taibaiella chishuiensis]PSK90283.1 GTP-binding protein [Taibaiella chishuiensis]